jgi:hypothetical protein
LPGTTCPPTWCQTCRHYLRVWHQAGAWRQLHAVLLAELNRADQIDW